MIDFVIYCLKCVGIAIAGAFGGNPEGLTFKTGIIGIITLFILFILGTLLVLGVLYIIAKIKK